MKPKLVIDTSDFMEWAIKKYKMTNDSWHDKIWDPHLSESFMESHTSVGFSHTENPENLLEEHINDFLLDFPELGDTVWMEFTN